MRGHVSGLYGVVEPPREGGGCIVVAIVGS